MKMSDNPTKYEVLIEQYLRSILDTSGYFVYFHCRHFPLPVQLSYREIFVTILRKNFHSAGERGKGFSTSWTLKVSLI